MGHVWADTRQEHYPPTAAIESTAITNDEIVAEADEGCC
jgi:hypothetical protein